MELLREIMEKRGKDCFRGRTTVATEDIVALTRGTITFRDIPAASKPETGRLSEDVVSMVKRIAASEISERCLKFRIRPSPLAKSKVDNAKYI